MNPPFIDLVPGIDVVEDQGIDGAYTGFAGAKAMDTLYARAIQYNPPQSLPHALGWARSLKNHKFNNSFKLYPAKSYPMKRIIPCAILTCIFLSGCAGTSQYVAAMAASDKTAVQAANDNIVTGIKDATCALPYGALLRHPEMQPAAKSICGTVNDASTLLPVSK